MWARGARKFGPDVSVCLVEEPKIYDTAKHIQKSLEESILFSFNNI